MSKKVLLLLLLISLSLCTPVLAAEGIGVFTVGSTEYLVDGQKYSMEVAPFIQEGRTFIPVRYVAGAMGIAPDDITYSNGEITLIADNKVVRLCTGSNVMVVNGVEINMDVDVKVVNGRAMLPVWWVGLALGGNVVWDEPSRTVTISGAGYFNPGESQAVRKVNPVTFTSTETAERDFGWIYNGLSYTWHVEIPDQLLVFGREINGLIDKFYDSNGAVQHSILASAPDDIKKVILSLATDGNYAPWAEEGENYIYAGYLAQRLKEQALLDGYDYFQTAEFVQSFVAGAIPYEFTDKPLLPAQTLMEKGDCKDKSILMAAILNNLGYKVALLKFPPPPGEFAGHMVVGVAFNANHLPTERKLLYYTNSGVKYYFAETTVPNWRIGEISDIKLVKKGSLYPVKESSKPVN